MEALDGNVIGGALLEYFGTEMTAVRGSCRHCGAVARIAELRVYVRAPGTVARCAMCGKVVMVVTTIRGVSTIDYSNLEVLDAPAGIERSSGA